jgi:hypothetical protein
MEWTFGNFLWSTVVFFFWIVCIWMFIGIFADILRRDMSGWAKAGWIVLIVFLPFLGILIYLIARPTPAAQYGSLMGEQRVRGAAAGGTAADQIAKAAQLHDEGRITADEFERLKQQALSY